MKLIGEFEIVEKAAVAPQQARVLAPQHRLSDGKFTHDNSCAGVVTNLTFLWRPTIGFGARAAH
jgi:hypothetical protein